MKQVEFDIKLVKKIQSGEVKGKVLTRGGMKARFLGVLNDDTYPLVFAITINGKELLKSHRKNGWFSTDESSYDIILEIEEPKQECQFKPFDKVLVRDGDEQEWKCALFSHNTKNMYRFVASSLYWAQCIPYEGNEHLVGTTNKPKED